MELNKEMLERKGRVRRVRGKVILLLIIILTLTAFGSPRLSDNIKVSYNGKEYAISDAVIHDGQILVPGAFVEEVLQREVSWAKEAANAAKPVYYSNKVAVLMYHHVMVKPTRADIISTEQFKRHMELLKREGFHPIGMEEYLAFLHKGKSVPVNAVLITFDDGYESFYTEAYPILKKLKFPAVNFVIVSSIGAKNVNATPKMTWDQMREMKKSGMEFFSHTYDMHKYGPINKEGKTRPMATRPLYLKKEGRTETQQEYVKRVTQDLSKAEQILKKELGNKRSVIAFPYGAYNEQVLKIAKSLGVEATFTVKKGINTPKDVNGFRFNGGRSDTTPAAIISILKGQDSSKKKLTTVYGKDAVLRIDGKLVSFPVLRKGSSTDTTLIPLRKLSQEVGIKLVWKADKRVAVLTE